MLTLLRNQAGTANPVVDTQPNSEAEPTKEELDQAAQLPEQIKDLFSTQIGTPIDPALINPHGVLNKKGIWPGYDGVPFRGPIPNLKSNDPQHRLPETGLHVHTDVLNFADATHLKKYNDILQVISNGAGVLRYEEKQYDEKISNWRILICWAELYSFMPKVK